MNNHELIKQAFEQMTGVPGAWTNPDLVQARNAFIQGWEAGATAENRACAQIADASEPYKAMDLIMSRWKA